MLVDPLQQVVDRAALDLCWPLPNEGPPWSVGAKIKVVYKRCVPLGLAIGVAYLSSAI
jgi:hypothetical protein